MKELFAILLCAIFMFLTACGAGDNAIITTVPVDSAETSEPNTVRLNGDYDSVPTVTLPKRLSEKELQAIKIPTFKDDPYSEIIAAKINWFKKSGTDFNSEMDRYVLYDINRDGVDELILGRISVLGGTSVYEEHEGIAAEYTYGILINMVYTVCDNQAVLVDNFLVSGQPYQMVVFDNGIIKVLSRTPRNPRITYYKMVEKSFQRVGDTLFKDYDGNCFYIGDIDDPQIAEEEFNRRIAEIEDGAHPVELEWKHLQDYGK